MAKKNTSKNGAVTTIKNGVNVDSANAKIVAELKECFSLEKELVTYLEIDRLNAEGLLSVRGIKATIEEVEKVGSAPSLKSAYAQDFPLVRSMRGLQGGEDKSLKELFNLAIAGRRGFGGTANMVEKIAGAKSIAALKKAIPAPVKRGAGKQTGDEKKAGDSAAKLNPVKVATALADFLEKGGNLPLELLERLSDEIAEAFNRL